MPPGDPDEWEQNIQINLTGPMRLTRRLTPAMAEKGEGYHINISSSAGKHPSPKQCAYSAAKWGMTGFALSSAKVGFEFWMLRKQSFSKQCAYSAAKWGMTGFALSSAKVGLNPACKPLPKAVCLLSSQVGHDWLCSVISQGGFEILSALSVLTDNPCQSNLLSQQPCMTGFALSSS